MKTCTLLLPLALTLLSCSTAAERGRPSPALQDAQQQQTEDDFEDDDIEEHGVGHALLWYIPNRISDVLDIVRLRLRVGPGFALGARVTELLDFNLGGYGTVWAGLPGPRRERSFNWPFGFESMAGAELLWWDGTTHGHGGPHYGAVEVGLGTQLILIGFDLGVDVWEIVDFATGIVFIDPVEDDI